MCEHEVTIECIVLRNPYGFEVFGHFFVLVFFFFFFPFNAMQVPNGSQSLVSADTNRFRRRGALGKASQRHKHHGHILVSGLEVRRVRSTYVDS